MAALKINLLAYLTYIDAESDLTQLQQQYRRAEGAKLAYTEKTRGIISRDIREIQRLQDEREGLLSNPRVSQSCNRLADASVVQNLTAKLACTDKIHKELEAEKGKVASLKDQILKWERKLVGQRSGGRTSCRSMHSEKSNSLKISFLIENKLHTAQKCFNKLMNKNGELREELKTLQIEKKQFFPVQSQLEKELHAVRKDICNLTAKSTKAFNASERLQEKQRMLRDQDAKDISQYIIKRNNLEREISHYCCLAPFINKKAIARNTQDIDHRKGNKCKQMEPKEMRLEDFEEAIKQILRETEGSNLEKVIEDLIQMEERSYTLLNFVNYQHTEAEAIRRPISQLCSEREIFVAEEQQEQEQHQDLQLRVSIKQGAREHQLAVYQQQIEFMEKFLDQLKGGVESSLQINYGSSVIRDQLGSTDKVDESIKQYLRMVEDRVNELLPPWSYLIFQEKINQWDFDSLSTIAEQVLGITQPAVSLTTAAATPAPDDPDLVESVLLVAKEPVSREDLLALVSKRRQKIRTTD